MIAASLAAAVAAARFSRPSKPANSSGFDGLLQMPECSQLMRLDQFLDTFKNTAIFATDQNHAAA